MSRIYENMPALGNSRGANYTSAEMSKDLQVYHLTTKHHPDQVYDSISPNFVNSIEYQKNPSGQYSRNMKSLHMDQLDASLNEYKQKMSRLNTQAQEFSKSYKENVNGVVAYMEKEERRRYQMLTDTVRKQEERQARFVDADKEKNRRLEDFINRNQYSNLMARSCLIPEKPVEDYPLNRERHTLRPTPVQQTNYQIPAEQGANKPLQRMGQSSGKLYRLHNPITNPIEYHIDNPYIINKMQQKFTSQHSQC